MYSKSLMFSYEQNLDTCFSSIDLQSTRQLLRDLV